MSISLKRYWIIAIILFALGNRVYSQLDLVKSRKYEYPVKSVSTHIYRIAVSLENGGVYVWHMPLFYKKGKSEVVQFNPSGAFVFSGDSKGKIKIWRSDERQKLSNTLRGHKDKITELDFDRNGNYLISGDAKGNVILWDVKSAKELDKINFTERFITSVGITNQGVFICADKSGYVNYFDTANFIKSYIRGEGKYIVDMSFSEDGDHMAFSYADGLIQLWDLNSSGIIKEFQGSANESNPIEFLPNSIYLAFSRNDSLLIYNLKNSSIQASAKAHNSKINDLAVIWDKNSQEVFLVSGGEDSYIHVWDANNLEKRYDVIIKEYVDSRIDEWQKMGEDETYDEYAARVTNENRMRKVKEFTQFITNKLALEKYPLKCTGISKYDYNNETFELEFDSTRKIVINVPYEDSKKFNTYLDQLMFIHPKFVLNEENDFDLAYLEVQNKLTDHVYVYDKNDDYSFDPASINIEFAPIKIAQQIAQTEELLKDKLEAKTRRSYLEEILTDNVQTNVSAKAVIEEDEQGEKEINFHVEYSYEVIKATIGAQTDDFPLGEYKFTSSNAAKMTLQVFKESLENELADYLVSGKKVTVKITGSTDATPVVGKIPYSGDYGLFSDEPYFLNGNLESISITPATGLTNNKQLAYLRTIGVRRFIENYIDVLKNTQNYYQHFAELADKKGGQYRRISIELIIHNAFEGMEELPDRIIHEECTSDVDVNVPETNVVKNNAYALVIGNENYSGYQKGLDKEADVRFAIHDAERVAEYLNKTIGIPERQIRLLKNATSGQIGQAITWLQNLAKIEKGNAEIYFYYSGHGLPDEITREAYIIPVDVTGANLAYALKLNDLFNSLAVYPAKQTTVLLDACFSGGARDKPLVEKKMVKVNPGKDIFEGNMIVISSSQGTESSGYLEENCHGLFTYFLLKKLQESNGNISYAEIFDYVKKHVLKESSLQGDVQTPVIKTGLGIDRNWSDWQF